MMHTQLLLPLPGEDAGSSGAEPFDPAAAATLHLGDRLELLGRIPAGEAALVVTSPPYNIGKSYETRTSLETWSRHQYETLKESVRILKSGGSLCWQLGNHILPSGEVYPLDYAVHPLCRELGLTLRNRIVWHFEHGLHCTKRFSGRYETVLWFTKGDFYHFDLDPVRVPQKYPNKRHFKGPKAGQLSGNPLGKSPGDVWIIPNVKHNHVEKTAHPCQFPVELVERLVLSMTCKDDLIVDPYMGTGTSVCAALLHGRRGAGAELVPQYHQIAQERVAAALTGELKTRPMNRPVYAPVRVPDYYLPELKGDVLNGIFDPK